MLLTTYNNCDILQNKSCERRIEYDSAQKVSRESRTITESVGRIIELAAADYKRHRIWRKEEPRRRNPAPACEGDGMPGG